MKLDEGMRVDGQSIGILKDKECATYVDYVFVASVWCKDPRHAVRFMLAGECRGLFRLDKATLGAALLLPLAGDDTGSRFNKAVWKVLQVFHADGCWPDKAQYASG